MKTPYKETNRIGKVVVKWTCGAVAALGLVSCAGNYAGSSGGGYEVGPPVKSVAVSQKQMGKPSVKFPTKVAVVSVNNWMKITDAQHTYRPEYGKSLSSLKGLNGVVNLNTASLQSGEVNEKKLRQSARKLGANMLAICRFNSSTQRRNGPAVVQLATLGVAPVNRHRAASTVSLTLMDARTGYIYGVLEGSGKKRALSSSWGNNNTEENAENDASQVAMDNLMKKVPAFWEHIRQRHR